MQHGFVFVTFFFGVSFGVFTVCVAQIISCGTAAHFPHLMQGYSRAVCSVSCCLHSAQRMLGGQMGFPMKTRLKNYLL